MGDHGLLENSETTLVRQFGGIYFSFDQAIALDAALYVARRSHPDSRDTLLAAALSVASQIVSSVGKQFAQPIRPRTKAGTVKARLIPSIVRDRTIDAVVAYREWLAEYSALPKTSRRAIAIRQDYLGALREYGGACSVIYADPPYTRDHYSRFYHVLETMALGDSPVVSMVKKKGALRTSRGVYREDRHQSPFCIRSEAPSAFASMFEEASEKGAALVLSYSPHETGDGTHPRVVSMSRIVDIARSYYSNVSVVAIEGRQHNQLNKVDLKLKTRGHAEVLLLCTS
jgi:hypothetical protein